MTLLAQPLRSITIIGAGIIGLSCAIELADRGVRVCLYDKAWPPRGASWAAAGMLAPAFEAAPTLATHPRLFELCDLSARLWPDWARALETRTGIDAGYHPGPSLAVARDQEQAHSFDQVREALKTHRDAPRDVSHSYLALEPALAANMAGALLLPGDGQADNRKTLAALTACAEAHANIEIQAKEAPLISRDGVLDHAGQEATLICAGWASAAVKAVERGAPHALADRETVLDEIGCYGGQMLAVAPIAGAPKMTVRCGHVYIVPKTDRIIIGATTEPGRVLERAEPEIIADLKQQAAEICPALADAPILDSWAGVRPGTKDHAPILGATRSPGLFVASGHYRNGILLAPVTAKIMSDLIVDGQSSELGRAFSPKDRLPAQV